MQATPTPSNTTSVSRSDEISRQRESSRIEARLPTAAFEQQDHSGKATSQEREDSGLCVKCGRELFRLKSHKGGLFGKKKTKSVRRVPLDVPGKVRRGQCLECGEDPEATSEDLGGFVVPVERKANHCHATYEGEFNVYGERDGHGTMKWANGDVYVGEFFNGNRHGSGTLTFADGSEYVGEWECNLQHGMGTRRFNNGDVYSGQYQNGKRTGEGRFYFSNGDMYTGTLLDGAMDGWGRYYYSSGQRFEGTFREGKRRGKGKLQRIDGSLDIGVYDDDVRTGIGVRWSADRTTAWKMLDGTVKKRISVPEAIALSYDIDASVRALDEPRIV